jgi:sodium/pantothenate symporter
MTQTSPATIITFVLYIGVVFVLAGLSHRLLSKKSFMGEYFLGSRGLGSWALAFTFAATSASGGSFTGYPSLIYSYGWVLAFWIASYMVVPICTMGVLGKRINQVARKTGAITLPDVLRDRFESTSLALIATCTIIFFTTCNLVAQFKAGAIIIEETFNLPAAWGYTGGLFIFAVTVVFYTAYGGFRAVVWTDVMQGIMMGIGVVILVPVVLMQAGGLQRVNELIRAKPPTLVTSMKSVYPNGNARFNDLAVLAVAKPIPRGLAYHHPGEPNQVLDVQLNSRSGGNWIDVYLSTDSTGERTISTGNDVKVAIESHSDLAQMVVIEYAFDNDETVSQGGEPLSLGATGVIELDPNAKPSEWVFVHGDEVIFGPGRTSTGAPFHPLGMAISFFFMWAISGMGQPGTMVRLMAFQESRTLKRAIITVTVYFGLIYLPLVFIFVAARTLIPHIPQESADKSMVLVATQVVAEMGLGYQILAAIFVAAPFAAVMSTVDSFLLMISSSLVRDIYQRTINPRVSDIVVKWASYTTTVVVGALVTLVALKPPDFLQYIIVFTGGGFAATFLFPTMLGLFWKGMTRQGAIASMLGGFTVTVGLFLPTIMEGGTQANLLGVQLTGGSRVNLFGFHPVFWALAASMTLGFVVSKLTGPPPDHLVKKYFYKRRES